MSEKHGTLEGFGFKEARLIDDGRLWKNIKRKEENAVKQQFSFFLKHVFHPIMKENSSCLNVNSSANASNLELPTILSFGRVEKLLEKKKLLVMCSFALSHDFIMIVVSESKRGLFKYIHWGFLIIINN